MNVIYYRKQIKILVQFRNKSELNRTTVHIKEGYLFRQPSLYESFLINFYLTSGFVDVSECGIGKKSTWPGLGSGFNRRKISFLSPT